MRLISTSIISELKFFLEIEIEILKTDVPFSKFKSNQRNQPQNFRNKKESETLTSKTSYKFVFSKCFWNKNWISKTTLQGTSTLEDTMNIFKFHLFAAVNESELFSLEI